MEPGYRWAWPLFIWLCITAAALSYYAVIIEHISGWAAVLVVVLLWSFAARAFR